MDLDLVKEKLLEKIPEKNIRLDVSMADETTFRCGGNAALFVTADDLEELKHALSAVKAASTKYVILGNGSNVLFTDSGFDGAVIKLGKEFTEVTVEGNRFMAGAAVMLSYLSRLAAAYSMSGLEFACGIPGTLGGGIYMNAGAYGGCMKDCLVSVTAMDPEGDIYKYYADELDLSYRHSRFQESGEIVLQAELELKAAVQEEIIAKMEENSRSRREKQPVTYPSAGSFFKRPEGYAAAALIDKAGLKGLSVGDAQVSELHAGFIINRGKASAKDVLELCRIVREKVYEDSGILLEPEVRIIGE
ncbi:MAG: UDP-N-acetylmuramate dehydrogenase [Firmicutes bacterium]|nr:UDP-N-acetylmuramate dehydrogenase [Bacillota bacterium]